jgi:hypothetical protein
MNEQTITDPDSDSDRVEHKGKERRPNSDRTFVQIWWSVCLKAIREWWSEFGELLCMIAGACAFTGLLFLGTFLVSVKAYGWAVTEMMIVVLTPILWPITSRAINQWKDERAKDDQHD